MILNQFGKPIKKDLSYTLMEGLGRCLELMSARDKDKKEQFKGIIRANGVRRIAEEVCHKKFPGGKGGTIKFRRAVPFTVKEPA